MALQLENTRAAAGNLVNLVLEAQTNRGDAGFAASYGERVAGEPQIERMAAIPDAQIQPLQFLG